MAEYGIGRLAMHRNAADHGERVLLADDLIATGGAAEAALRLGYPVLALCEFPGH